MVTMWRGAYTKSPPGYDHPDPKLGADSLQSKLASQTAAKRCQMRRWLLTAMCTYHIGKVTIALPNCTIVDPLGAPLSRTGVIKKLNSKLL